jgi:hypothetical protein
MAESNREVNWAETPGSLKPLAETRMLDCRIFGLVLEVHLVGPKSKFPTIQHPSCIRTPVSHVEIFQTLTPSHALPNVLCWAFNTPASLYPPEASKISQSSKIDKEKKQAEKRKKASRKEEKRK